MSKEDWIRAYERGLANGESESLAIKNADERAAFIQASRTDAAMEHSKWCNNPHCACQNGV